MAVLKVLIVDDEVGIRSGLTRILKNFSVDFPFVEEAFTFETIEVGTGEEALSYLDSTPIDIVLLDNKLPGIHGIEVLEYINNKNIDTNVMMITSYASLDLAIKATNNGAYNFVPKPFTPQELKTAMEGITKHLYLSRMTKTLNEESKQVRFQFLSVLSHELKSPINAIEGYLRIMQDKQVGTDLNDYEQMIERSLERIRGMRSLIMDMLDLTKLENGKKKREITKVDVVQIAQISIDTMTPLAAQKNVKIFLDSDQPNIYMNADNNEMEIIFNNLISNAVKYNKTNGTVEIKIATDDNKISIAVSDTGIGMSEDDIAKLFQEFSRIKNEKTKGISGSGLGLSILKKTVEDFYHGTVTVKSTPDVGSTFTVEIPKNY
ncbi:MAG TPA: ATP-binding protein [Bacteroidales bacterium]|nr:ATP-binding protein [Bacteroidales bacterium]HPB24490.1 ATP-binding protein [Bacteroidales bacterium]HPI30546.1 ATP-binding protein [Bacteroidales bacterium]HQN15025.1 ATP-binding protein [Bacteroidales bacterium]HQP14909.1 ATP-binding protein [Bacteroidales bacterium]